MNINFEKPLTEEQQSFINSALGDQLKALDDHIGLLEVQAINQKQMRDIANQKQMRDIANKTNQVLIVELNNIGDRKEVGGIVYELDESGWKKLPIKTTL